MQQAQVLDLPRAFCWTRFGVHAGEPITSILERKEVERRLNGGVFLWGIGNSVRNAVAELVRRTDAPEVLFSPIKSRPRGVDASPDRVVTWTAAELLDGQHFSLPERLRVNSHQRLDGPMTAHYALVCESDSPLRFEDLGPIQSSCLHNLLTGRQVGASQVTAVVEVGDCFQVGSASYPVMMRVRLAPPYFLRLLEPRDLRSRASYSPSTLPGLSLPVVAEEELSLVSESF